LFFINYKCPSVYLCIILCGKESNRYLLPIYIYPGTYMGGSYNAFTMLTNADSNRLGIVRKKKYSDKMPVKCYWCPSIPHILYSDWRIKCIYRWWMFVVTISILNTKRNKSYCIFISIILLLVITWLYNIIKCKRWNKRIL